ncbi:MAG: carbon-nitrogen hydrolase family protein [Terriglobia bacterium]
MERRKFLTNIGIGMLPLAAGGVMPLRAASEGNGPADWESEPKIGRPVRLVSIGYSRILPLNEIVEYVDREGAKGADAIVLPELCRGHDKTSQEPLHGPTVTAMSALAKKHKTYVAVPIDRRDGERRFNTVVLLDRSGKVVALYNKIFPYWNEFDVAPFDAHPSVTPGDAAEVYKADFGHVGFATCYDINFSEVWRRLSDKGAEVVIWPSAYSGGIPLQAYAANYHYYVFSCTLRPDCSVYDVTGERLLYGRGSEVNVSRITLDLDRGIYHENFNLAKRNKLLKEHPQDVMQEQWLHSEQWFVLKAKRPGVSARELAHQYGLEELRHYIERSRAWIDKRRGWEFEEKIVYPRKNLAQLKEIASEISA